MVQILHKGTPPQDRDVKGTCNNCKSVLAWKAHEGQHQSDQRDGDFNSIQCPVCNHPVWGTYAR